VIKKGKLFQAYPFFMGFVSYIKTRKNVGCGEIRAQPYILLLNFHGFFPPHDDIFQRVRGKW